MTRSTVAKMDGTSGSHESASNRDHNEITPMHAAAVNGDKSSLAKLLVGKLKHIPRLILKVIIWASSFFSQDLKREKNVLNKILF